MRMRLDAQLPFSLLDELCICWPWFRQIVRVLHQGFPHLDLIQYFLLSLIPLGNEFGGLRLNDPILDQRLTTGHLDEIIGIGVLLLVLCTSVSGLRLLLDLSLGRSILDVNFGILLLLFLFKFGGIASS